MKRVLAPLGGLALLVALTFAVGALLSANHVATVRARYARPPQELWAMVSDFASWPTWNSRVMAMERLPDRDGQPGWVMVDHTGRLPLRVVEVTTPSADTPGRIVTRIDDDSLPFGGTWTWTIAHDGSGSLVTLTENGEIRNPLFRLLARAVFGYTSTTESFLAALGTSLGEPVTPEVLPVRHGA